MAKLVLSVYQIRATDNDIIATVRISGGCAQHHFWMQRSYEYGDMPTYELYENDVVDTCEALIYRDIHVPIDGSKDVRLLTATIEYIIHIHPNVLYIDEYKV